MECWVGTAQQLLAFIDWSAAWFGVPVTTEEPVFPIRLPPNGRELALWNAVSTRFRAVYTQTWSGRHVSCCLL